MNEFYELVENNEHFLVVYKKPNTSFHSEDGERGLFETVKQTQGLSELYPVHRLDKITSGLLVMAKTADANQELVDQFKNRQIEKYYIAISKKKPKKKQGLIKGDMGSARRGAWKLLPTFENPAVTQFFSASIGNGMRLFMVKPHTGKTHQIRVALKSIGSPILGDALYADAADCEGVDRVYLHAFSLAFSLGGQDYRFTEAPREGEIFATPEFVIAMNSFQSPWLLHWPRI
ncbi:RNA pseudouridine synthase [Cellvibrio zantedeschiae]|uniref:RNA pseudouridine synthase n=1 Tax=Cellvibrio zantedeschiae TaxID=1237077 RepID=A0ABQ3AXW8_9GAMM|nr:TIGR01621 family pseudouridine synthase [Cellvibrio zantedeschiae]GGY70123.1 RNA pseudouridine synthase [Cellvibrio zantedeschiae]